MSIASIGEYWLDQTVDGMTDHMERMSVVEFNEKYRYLASSVTSQSGPINFDVNPFMIEIADAAGIDSPVREINLMKGSQITWSTLLESVAFYYLGHIKILPMMYITADRELADARIESNFIPMLNNSGFEHIIQSHDVTSSHKSGKTKKHIQVEGGGFLIPYGAQSAHKMRQWSICIMLKDEMDGWPIIVGRDGNPDKLTDDRCLGFWDVRKILRGSTPLIKDESIIYKQFLRGDQRRYVVLCLRCGYGQWLDWKHKDGGGFGWETENDILIQDSVHYACKECNHKHYEYDKDKLFSLDYGAHWQPTAVPESDDIRSYHLPSFYSPIGMRPWHKTVQQYLNSVDPNTKKVFDIGAYQVLYNNEFAWPFEEIGTRVRYQDVCEHRVTGYAYGFVPNSYAVKYTGHPVKLITCQVDVHKNNLAVAVMGWTPGMRTFLIDYWRFEDKSERTTCEHPESPVWARLQDLIETKRYKIDDQEHPITLTLIDARYATATVESFCAMYENGVFPIMGVTSSTGRKNIKQFSEFTTQIGTVGFQINVDYYKDRLAPVLRRQWVEGVEEQQNYHFNVPFEATDEQLKELTAEYRRKKIDKLGRSTYEWYRPSGARNELWDLLVYGHAGVEILANNICIQVLGLDSVDWGQFWGQF